ncbi:hypothetical protein WKS02_001141 [Yersinia enterocolitica]|uniref:hypothetical protein n=1 Tax=Yersinia enterocolitica TaxID=630 RepID=UPI0005DE0D5E|nr:hypothetical protein [Yersinia enterocolitica]EKN3596704.1 hypothetical protein [Yersinia enterocolitica]EKN4899352.1 hypothetical protein [Yersinia enterocolitica]UXD30563.1 hypothetical protein FORC066_3356 [Yersinia enterocolitica]CFQ74305.1 Uncharacterised protein [Yersinia enterocolitica]HDL7461489.1 hypothetical protein [Yersinia enterocolitica]
MLSKEQLEKIANQGPVDIGGAQNPIVTEMATELLSLREQMAELKALPPFSWGLADKDGNAYLSECCIGDEGCMIDEAEAYNYELEPEHHIHAVPLFTASKPAED